MWLACCSGSLEVTKLLQKYNADVNIPDNRGATPLVSAFKKGHTRTCAWLVKDSGCTARLENFIFVCNFFQFFSCHFALFPSGFQPCCILPSSVECERIISTLKTDNEMTLEILEKCKDCYSIIDLARRQKEEESNAKAKALLEELEFEEMEKVNKQNKKSNKKKKKAEKKEADKRAKEEEERKKKEAEEKRLKQVEDKKKKEEAKQKRADEKKQKDADKKKKKEEEAQKKKDDEVKRKEQAEARKQAKIKAQLEEDAKIAKEFARQEEENQKFLDSQANWNNVGGETNVSSNSEKSSSNEFQVVASKKDRKKKTPAKIEEKADPKKSATAVKSKIAHIKISDFKAGDFKASEFKISDFKPAELKSGEKSADTKLTPTPTPSYKSGDKSKSDSFSKNDGGSDSRTNNFSPTNFKSGDSNYSGFEVVSEYFERADYDKNALDGPIDTWNNVETNKTVNKKDANVHTVRVLKLQTQQVARVIGRQGCNVNRIRDETGTHIDIEKAKKNNQDRTVTIRGAQRDVIHTTQIIEILIGCTDRDIEEIISTTKPEKESVKVPKTDGKKSVDNSKKSENYGKSKNHQEKTVVKKPVDGAWAKNAKSKGQAQNFSSMDSSLVNSNATSSVTTPIIQPNSNNQLPTQQQPLISSSHPLGLVPPVLPTSSALTVNTKTAINSNSRNSSSNNSPDKAIQPIGTPRKISPEHQASRSVNSRHASGSTAGGTQRTQNQDIIPGFTQVTPSSRRSQTPKSRTSSGEASKGVQNSGLNQNFNSGLLSGKMSGQNKSGGGLLKNPVTMINSSFGLLGLSGGEKTSSSFDSTKANASGISVSSPVVDVNQMLTDTFAPPALQSVQPKGK